MDADGARSGATVGPETTNGHGAGCYETNPRMNPRRVDGGYP